MSSNPFLQQPPDAPDVLLDSGVPTDYAFPPHLWMPGDGFPFDPAAYVATPAVGVTSTVLTFTVPEGQHGVIWKVGNVFVGAGFVEGSGSLIWQIVQDNGVVRNYDSIVASLGAVSNPTQLSGPILIYEGQVIKLQVQNVSLVVGGTQVGGRLSGWFFPKSRLMTTSGR
jgi:hypothetical protein